MLFRFLSLAFASLLFSACENETEKNQAALVGRWQLTKGFRNKNETHTLQGVYYQFGADGKMQTNLPIGAETPTDYVVQQGDIEQRSAQPVKYHILSLNDSVLVMSLDMQGVPFEFHFRRAVDSLSTPPLPGSDSISR